MQGILNFHNSSQASFQPYKTEKARRTKSGCLNCRIRHTKCDEHRPICNACIRNHLLCSWPDGARVINPPKRTEDPSRKSRRARSSSHALSPSRSVSLWPRLQGKPAEQRLLHHYLEKSSRRLVIRESGQNPFVAYLLPLAQQNDGLLHAVFAISASHLSFHDTEARLTALSHYGVALRAAKYQITEFGNGQSENALEIILLLVALCAFEVIDGNVDGAVMHHWRLSTAILTSQRSFLENIDEGCGRFIAEQYMFIGLVNEYLGLSPPSAESPAQPDNSFLDLSSYYRDRCSMCAYALFEIIPRIAGFASTPSKSLPRHHDAEMIEEFHSLEEDILQWDIQNPVTFPSNTPTEPEQDEVKAAIIQQLALLITLHCALHGPGTPPATIKQQIDCCITEAMVLMKEITPPSSAWGMLLWPLAHIASCITIQEVQEDFVEVISNMENQVHGCTKLLSLLSRFWGLSEQEGFYGPYGIREFLSREGMKPCFG